LENTPCNMTAKRTKVQYQQVLKFYVKLASATDAHDLPRPQREIRSNAT
jgi:hypothetical protein